MGSMPGIDIKVKPDTNTENTPKKTHTHIKSMLAQRWPNTKKTHTAYIGPTQNQCWPNVGL